MTEPLIPTLGRPGRLRPLALLALLALLPPRPAAADTLRLADAAPLANVTVRAITATAVRYDAPGAPGTERPLAQVKSIQFSQPPVVAKPGGLILADGSRLSGVLAAWLPELIFRSSLAGGRLDLPREEVAAIYYSLPQLQRSPTKPAAFPTALDLYGGGVTGRLLWADAESAGIRGADGLKRFAAPALAAILFAPLPTAALRLRNGDVLNATPTCLGDSLKVKVGRTMVTVPLAAIAEIQFEQEK
jgi:hypothetical protein